MIRLLLAILISLAAFAQDHPKAANELPLEFYVDYGGSLSSATQKITIQLPTATAGTRVRLKAAKVYCSVACTATQERNGTAATATALTVNKHNPEATGTLTVLAYRSSNVGSAAQTYTVDEIAAGQTLPLTLGPSAEGDRVGGVYLIGTTGAVNYSIGLASMTGNYRITIIGEQY